MDEARSIPVFSRRAFEARSSRSCLVPIADTSTPALGLRLGKVKKPNALAISAPNPFFRKLLRLDIETFPEVFFFLKVISLVHTETAFISKERAYTPAKPNPTL
jgi:hypothetical protein